MGYDSKLKLAQASNAKYNEMAFSSAEDLDVPTSTFGGNVLLKDVGDNNPTVVTGQAHTGNKSVSVSTGKSFIYKSGSLTTNRRYRASAWTNSTNGRIYYKINNGSEQTSAAPTQQVGGWYLINIEIPIGSSTSEVEVGVKSSSGSVLFDDFRFQPAQSGMTCYVYHPVTQELEYVLDNNNTYTKYEYNDVGMLIKTYQESLKFGVKLISESKINYRRFN